MTVTDENGYFTYDKFYPGEVEAYGSLHSDGNSEIVWKYCLDALFTCPKNPKKYTLKEPLVAEFASMVNLSKLSILPKTGGSFIDPVKIKTLKTSYFQNTFVATKEFEQRLQLMHQLENGPIILETYIQNLSEPLWKCDKKAAELLGGSNKQIFENFAEEHLTNVKNDGIHQEALMKYYTDHQKAYQAENLRRLNDHNAKTSAEINAQIQAINETLDSPNQLALAQASRKGRIPANTKMVKTSSNKTTRTVRTDSYAFSWSSNSWCNIDRYLGLLGPTPWATSITTNFTDKDITVYRTVRELQTVIELEQLDGSYRSLTSRSGADNDVFCVAVHRVDDELYYGAESFDGSSMRNVDLNLEPVSEDQFYLNLCSLAPSESLIAKELKADLARLKTHTRLDEKNKRHMNLLRSARNEVSSDVIVYNRLFDYLVRSNKGLVQ